MKIENGQYGLFSLDDEIQNLERTHHSRVLRCVNKNPSPRFITVEWLAGTGDTEDILKQRLLKVLTKEEHPEYYI